MIDDGCEAEDCVHWAGPDEGGVYETSHPSWLFRDGFRSRNRSDGGGLHMDGSGHVLLRAVAAKIVGQIIPANRPVIAVAKGRDKFAF